MSNKVEIIDARGGDHVIATGKILRQVIRGRVGTYQDAYKKLMERMNNELSTKEASIPLMIALAVNDTSVNEQALFFRACIDRATWLDKEIRELNTLGQSFAEDAVYRITVKDAARFGV